MRQASLEDVLPRRVLAHPALRSLPVDRQAAARQLPAAEQERPASAAGPERPQVVPPLAEAGPAREAERWAVPPGLAAQSEPQAGWLARVGLPGWVRSVG